MNCGVLRDQPYGVVIEPLIRGSVDAMRQHCPAKRLTPMGLLGYWETCACGNAMVRFALGDWPLKMCALMGLFMGVLVEKLGGRVGKLGTCRHELHKV